MCIHFKLVILGNAIQQAGGKEFQDEVQNLIKSNGDLDTAGGNSF